MDSTNAYPHFWPCLRKQGWIHVKPGKDRRERVFRLTAYGKRGEASNRRPLSHIGKLRRRHLREGRLGSSGWKQMQTTVAQVHERGDRGVNLCANNRCICIYSCEGAAPSERISPMRKLISLLVVLVLGAGLLAYFGKK